MNAPQIFDRPDLSLMVYRADDIRVLAGVNRRDPLTAGTEMVLEDTYGLRRGSRPVRLALRAAPDGGLSVAPGSGEGQPGMPVTLDCLLRLLSDSGETLEGILLGEATRGRAQRFYLLPLGEIAPGCAYTLISTDAGAAAGRLAKMGCAAFARGTHVMLADGTQVLIETLRKGDWVLTRDHGAQQIAWITHQTLRASGPLAPVLIRRGALNNTGDLVIGRDHRLFVYRRSGALGAEPVEHMIRAGSLVGQDGVLSLQGGHVDYFQLLFNRPEIVYVEGIAAECLPLGPPARPGQAASDGVGDSRLLPNANVLLAQGSVPTGPSMPSRPGPGAG